MNLSVGFVGIVNAFTPHYKDTIYFILLAAFFDLLDGFFARLLKVTSSIGKQLDSFADLVSFGILPAVFLYQLMSDYTAFELILYTVVLIPVFSAIRLARFNLNEDQLFFSGLPTPANAIMISSFYLLPEKWLFFQYAHLIIIIMSAILMVSGLRLVSFKFDGLRWTNNQSRIMIVLILIVVLVLFQEESLPFVVPLYILSSLAGNFIWRNRVDF